MLRLLLDALSNGQCLVIITHVKQEIPHSNSLVRTVIQIVSNKVYTFTFFTELLTPVKEKKWFEDYKMELQFLQQNFSEVLPEILYDVVRKRVTDPVHYIVHYLIKYKVYKLRDVKMYNYLF